MTELQALHILGLDPNRATIADVKPAYRAKAKLLHPDKGGDTVAFKHLVAAYELLTGRSRVRQPVRRPQPVRVVRVYVGFAGGTTTSSGWAGPGWTTYAQ